MAIRARRVGAVAKGRGMTRRDHPLATWLLGKRRKTPEIIAMLPPYRELLAIPNGWSRSFIIEHLRGAVQRTVAKAIREGAITRPLNCSECGVTGRIEAHHDDYDQPMVIRWLCRPCHRCADMARRRREKLAA
jgi:hypothetical protein